MLEGVEAKILGICDGSGMEDRTIEVSSLLAEKRVFAAEAEGESF